jgi:hypothetical protein
MMTIRQAGMSVSEDGTTVLDVSIQFSSVGAALEFLGKVANVESSAAPVRLPVLPSSSTEVARVDAVLATKVPPAQKPAPAVVQHVEPAPVEAAQKPAPAAPEPPTPPASAAEPGDSDDIASLLAKLTPDEIARIRPPQKRGRWSKDEIAAIKAEVAKKSGASPVPAAPKSSPIAPPVKTATAPATSVAPGSVLTWNAHGAAFRGRQNPDQTWTVKHVETAKVVTMQTQEQCVAALLGLPDPNDDDFPPEVQDLPVTKVEQDALPASEAAASIAQANTLGIDDVEDASIPEIPDDIMLANAFVPLIRTAISLGLIDCGDPVEAVRVLAAWQPHVPVLNALGGDLSNRVATVLMKLAPVVA